MDLNTLQSKIEEAYVDRTLLKDKSFSDSVEQVIKALDRGELRVAEPQQNLWKVNEWVKKAILLYFALRKVESMSGFSGQEYFDKIPLKSRETLSQVRTVPGAIARYGCTIKEGAILMPSFVNIGAYVGEETMVDTWATVGSCAQVGKRVHLSGGVGIGGVLEPPQAAPVIIEDYVFVGSRAIVVEGVRVCEGAVLGANVVLTASTKILDVTSSELVEHRGYVPPRSVVIPGTHMKSFPAGSFGVPVALIIGQRKASTDLKTSLNETLRDFEVAV